jgi:phage FluMu gp28-like protein
MQGLNLLKSQQDWINDRSRLGIFLCTRQGGKTYSTALKRVDRAFESLAKGKPTQTVILSRSERQSRIAMKQVVRFCKSYGATLDTIESHWKDHHDHETDYLSLEIRLPNDSSILALPANPDTARGNSAHLWLDEFAIHPDSYEIWGAVYGLITRGYELDITSTPQGLNNKFADIWHSTATKADGSPLWAKHYMDIYDAVAQGLPLEDGIEGLKAGLDDDDFWAQEYECKFLDGAHSWLSLQLIHAAEHDKAGDPDLYQGNSVYIGIDIGLRRDLWVLWAWELVGDVFWCREITCIQRGTFDDHDAALARAFDRYQTDGKTKIVRVSVDQTGMGEKVVFDWQKKYGPRVEGVTFTLQSKHHLATLGKQAFEKMCVRIPRGDRNLINDLHKLKRIVTPAGNARFDADRDSNGHADRTWAAFLGIYAADRPLMVKPMFTIDSPESTTHR